MARSFAAHGYDVDRWKIDPAVIKDLPGASPVAVSYDNAWTVVGAWRPDRPTGKSLALNGHVDVVPTGPLDMGAATLRADHRGDWMYGRGAGDMKCGVAANLFAMAALKTAGVMPAADVYLQTVIEEECTGNGALSCFARGYHPDAALIPEPLGRDLDERPGRRGLDAGDRARAAGARLGRRHRRQRHRSLRAAVERAPRLGGGMEPNRQ